MKQKIVIKVSMPREKSRSRAMSLVARATGVTSVEIAGDGNDRLEVVGDGIDTVRLVTCLRRKLGSAQIVQVEVMKDKKPEEEKKPEVKKKPEEPEKPIVVHPPPQFYPCYYQQQHHYPPPPRMVVLDEPGPCSII